jgi:hypothetical protein
MIRTVNYAGGITATIRADRTWSVRIGIESTDGLTLPQAARLIVPAAQFPGAGIAPTYAEIVAPLARKARETESAPGTYPANDAWDDGYAFRMAETHPTGNMPFPEGYAVDSPTLDGWEDGYAQADDDIRTDPVWAASRGAVVV